MQAAERKCALYRITCKTTGLSYIGITVNPTHRWQEHVYAARRYRILPLGPSKLHASMAKYGVIDHEHQILAYARNSEAAGQLEQLAIALGMGPLNILRGGQHGRLGHKASNETRLKQSLVRQGKKRSREVREAQSARQRGTIPWAAVAAAALLRKGEKLSDGIRAKMSAARKGNTSAKGSKRSPEHLAAMKRGRDAHYEKRRLLKEGGVRPS